MEFNAAQNKFIQDLRTMLPLYQQSSDPKLKAPATNLEWNLKKLTGEYAAESLDAATYVTRTKADLALIVDALSAGAAGQEFASNAIGDLEGIFGVGTSAGSATATAGTASPASGGGNVSGSTTSAAGAPAGAAISTEAVKSLLAQKADSAGEDLDWKRSVVDLLKLLGKDSSQGARRRYAVSLGFPEQQIGQMPSAEFNTWLHGQLLGLMASNGGNLPSNIA